MALDVDSTKAVADQLAEAIAPKAVAHLRDNWDGLCDAIPSGMARFAVRHNQEPVLGLVPPLAKVGAEVAMDELASLTAGDIMRAIARHASDRGVGVHPTVARFALAASEPEPAKSEFQRMGDRVKGS